MPSTLRTKIQKRSRFTFKPTQTTPNDAEILRRISKQYNQLMLDAKTSARRTDLEPEGTRRRQTCSGGRSTTPKPIYRWRLFMAESRLTKRPAERSGYPESSSRKRKPLRASIKRLCLVCSWALGYEIANFNPVLRRSPKQFTVSCRMPQTKRPMEYLQKAIALQPRRHPPGASRRATGSRPNAKGP